MKPIEKVALDFNHEELSSFSVGFQFPMSKCMCVCVVSFVCLKTALRTGFYCFFCKAMVYNVQYCVHVRSFVHKWW